MIEKLYDLENLYESFLDVKAGSGWKERTQRYEEDLMMNLVGLVKRLREGTYRPSPPHTFLINERGKTRLIESYCIEDRIVQGCFVKKILMPICLPKLIYDNSASVKKRGTDHFRRRLEYHLKSYEKKHGNDGYILLGDFTKFFDNIWHESFTNAMRAFGADEEVLSFLQTFLDTHCVDVSYMTDEQYGRCMLEPFNAIEYEKIDKSLKTGRRWMKKSVGIGSQIAQVAGVVTPYRMDNYIKIVKGIKYYGRYMDDFYVVDPSKEYLRELLEEVDDISKELGLILNRKKTQIVSLKHEFTILKTGYRLC